MIPKKPAPDVIRGGYRFSEKIMLRGAKLWLSMGDSVMSGESLLVILVVGLIAGWLAGLIVRGTGFGIVADICIGIIGALIASWLFPRLGVHLGTGMISRIIAATLGAILLLLILRLVHRRGRW
jgi:uncharacterized membrane protein YeaQ/YmgE (transglycosylase-associated protein family)